MENVNRLLGLGRKVFLGGCIYYTLTRYFYDFWRLSEDSMAPTLCDGEIVVTCPSGRLNLSKLQLEDVVITRSPTDPKSFICKRIKALPGDRTPSSYLGPIAFIPAGQVWLEGDNSSVSCDSRYFGPIPLGLIEGLVICRMWPVNSPQPQLSHKG